MSAVGLGVLTVFLVFAGIAIGLGAIVGAVAASKGRDRRTWWAIGTFFFIPALIALAVMKPDERGLQRQWTRSGGALCVECRGLLNDGASRCHRCGSAQGARGGSRSDDDAATFFRHELASVTANRHLRREVEVLLGFASADVETESDRVAERCMSVVHNAIAEVPDEQFVGVDGLALPEHWVPAYESLLNEDPPRRILGYLSVACIDATQDR